MREELTFPKEIGQLEVFLDEIDDVFSLDGSSFLERWVVGEPLLRNGDGIGLGCCVFPTRGVRMRVHSLVSSLKMVPRADTMGRMGRPSLCIFG